LFLHLHLALSSISTPFSIPALTEEGGEDDGEGQRQDRHAPLLRGAVAVDLENEE